MKDKFNIFSIADKAVRFLQKYIFLEENEENQVECLFSAAYNYIVTTFLIGFSKLAFDFFSAWLFPADFQLFPFICSCMLVAYVKHSVVNYRKGK